MRIVLQRVKEASVTVAGERISNIGPGLLLLVGVAGKDGEPEADWLAGKIAGLRIMGDGEGKMNLSIMDTGGTVLAVSVGDADQQEQAQTNVGDPVPRDRNGGFFDALKNYAHRL